MIFWIRKNKHKRLTCKNILYDQKIPQEWQHISYLQKTSIIYLYIYLYIFLNLLYPLKYTKEAAIGQSEELVHQHVFEKRFKYPSAVDVKT